MGITSSNSLTEVAATMMPLDDHTICHECEGRVVRAYSDHPYRYKDVTLILKNLPAWKCTQCEDEMFGVGTLRKHLIRAREHYDTTGETVYDCL